jgi:hypothetical protein
MISRTGDHEGSEGVRHRELGDQRIQDELAELRGAAIAFTGKHLARLAERVGGRAPHHPAGR